MRTQTYREFYENLFSEFLNKKYEDPPLFGGTHRHFKTPKDLAASAINYFEHCKQSGEHMTLEGLKLHCKIFSKTHLSKYEHTVQYSEDFASVFEIIQKVIEYELEQDLFDKSTFNAARFVLQAKWGWVPSERQIIQNDTVNVSIGKKNPEA